MNDCDINYRQSSNKRLLVELTLIQVAQITQPEDQDVPNAGRQPHRLKSLFQKFVIAKPKPAIQVAGADKTALHATRSAQKQNTKAVAATETVAPASTDHSSDKATKKTANSIKLGSIGFTFNNLLNPKKQTYGKSKNDEELNQVVETPQPNSGEAMKFTQEELDLQWLMMCKRMPPKMIGLAQRLRNSNPVITDYPNIEVVVENEILLEQIQGIKNRIRATLAQYLHNPNIQLDARLAKAEEARKILTKREIFDEMREKNPAIEKLRKLMNLELA